MILLVGIKLAHSQFEWITYDKIDEIMEKMNAVNADNCAQKQPSELQLIEDVVYHPPTIELVCNLLILFVRLEQLYNILLKNLSSKRASSCPTGLNYCTLGI